MHDYDPNSGIIFYSQVAINGVSCYNTKKPFSTDNHAIIQRDDNAMIYPSDLNVNMRYFFDTSSGFDTNFVAGGFRGNAMGYV